MGFYSDARVLSVASETDSLELLYRGNFARLATNAAWSCDSDRTSLSGLSDKKTSGSEDLYSNVT